MSKGNDSKPNQFGGVIGSEIDRIWAAIRADKIVPSSGVKVSRTTAGTFVDFDVKAQEIEEPPPTDWRISEHGATMPFTYYTHIEEFYGGTFRKTGRTMYCFGPAVGQDIDRGLMGASDPSTSWAFGSGSNVFSANLGSYEVLYRVYWEEAPPSGCTKEEYVQYLCSGCCK